MTETEIERAASAPRRGREIVMAGMAGFWGIWSLLWRESGYPDILSALHPDYGVQTLLAVSVMVCALGHAIGIGLRWGCSPTLRAIALGWPALVFGYSTYRAFMEPQSWFVFGVLVTGIYVRSTFSALQDTAVIRHHAGR